MNKEKFIIIDGNSLLHRSFHALPPLTTKNGEMINAAYGFTMTLLKAMREIKPKYIAVTFDMAEPTFRHKLYEDYKGTRVKPEGIEELYNQIPKLKKILTSFHIPFFEKAGFEADDIIGTISHKLNIRNNMPQNSSIETIIVTGDLDTLQLVNKNTKVYTLKKGLSETVIYDEEKVKKRFEGLTAEQMIDYKALRGDPSDNIPGVKGIGEKGAIKLLSEFTTIENLYKKIEDNDDFLPQKLVNKLVEYKDDALLSKTLATINLFVPIPFVLENCEWQGYDKNDIFSLFQEYEFRTLIGKLPSKIYDNDNGKINENQKKDETKKNYKLVDTEEKIEDFIKNLKKQEQIVLDTETTSTNPIECELLGISFCWKPSEAYYIPFSNLEKYPVLFKELKELIEDDDIKKCGHNIKYDMLALSSCSITLAGINFDTMIASYLLNPGSRAHGLDNLVFTELGHQMIPIENLIGKGKQEKNMAEVELAKISEYSCEDADYTFRLMQHLKPKLNQYKSDEIFNEIEIPLIPVLAEIEKNGIKLDAEFLEKLNKKLSVQIKKTEEEIFKMAGYEFNISSPIQLKELLFDKLKISAKNIKKGKTGLSTAASELNKLRGKHPIIDLISEYREFSKLISTYVSALPKLINKKTERIHTSFNQTITATGRLSSSNPNLQNIPIRTELGKSIRKAFIAKKGYKIISADYSQVELRIIASLSKDEKMINAFKSGADIHTSTAAEIFKVSSKDVTKNMRRQAKAINFGIIYGMGPRGLAESANISYEEAQNFIDEYFILYKNVKIYIDDELNSARKKGYVETFFGRRRYLPEIASNAPFIRSSAERMAINHPIQGTSADLIKIAMINLHKKISGNADIKMILQIHDELLFEVKESFAKNAEKLIKEEMENAAKFEASIKVDIKIGDNWGEL